MTNVLVGAKNPMTLGKFGVLRHWLILGLVLLLGLLVPGILLAGGRGESGVVDGAPGLNGQAGDQSGNQQPRPVNQLMIVAIGQDGDMVSFAQAGGLELENQARNLGIPLNSLSFSWDSPGSVRPPYGQIVSALSPSMGDLEIAQRIGQVQGFRYVALIYALLENRRVVWRIGVFDTFRNQRLSSDASAGFAGLSVLPLIQESARRVARVFRSLESLGFGKVTIDYSLVFRAPGPGVDLYLGNPEAGALLGTSRQVGFDSEPETDQELWLIELEYMPFEAGQGLVLTAVMEGHYPREFRVEVELEQPQDPILIPWMQPVLTKSLYWGIGVPRLLGITGGMRLYLFSDRFFLGGENTLWTSYAFLPGARPLIHNEARMVVAGHLFTQPQNRFRITNGIGVGTILTFIPAPNLDDQVYADLILDPLMVGFEYHFNWGILWAEIRKPFAFGTGLLDFGWLDPGSMGILITLGGMTRW